MCAIAGWIAPRGAGPDPDALAPMLAAQRHRGPDGEGVHLDAAGGAEVALGHRRLAIIDLRGGAQPMALPDGTAITFNGEIYNHRDLRAELERAGAVFASASDTEVLLHGYRAWGATGLLERLNGMYAFALWDPRAARLLLARDPFGQKPLFYRACGEALAFASEIKGLLALPGGGRRLDHEALGLYLSTLFVPQPRTLFAGIAKLAAGHAAFWEAGRLTVWRHWAPPDRQPPGDAPDGDPVERFRTEFAAAVRRHLIADVPVGAFLSGGLDSSAVVAAMARAGGTVRTFSVGFAEEGYSELPYARRVARHLGCEHHELEFAAGDLAALLAEATRHRDAPVSEPADLPLFALSGRARSVVTVVLTGEGADETLGGYPRDLAEPWVGLWQRLVPPALHRRAVAPLARCLPYGARRARILAQALGEPDFARRALCWMGEPDAAATLLPLPPPAAEPGSPGNTPLRRMLALEQGPWLSDNLLERGDRMTMAHALESRMPFLDRGLVDLVSRLPDRWRVSGLSGKRVLRRAVAPWLPRDVVSRPKVGFRLPVHAWFRGPLRAFLCDLLTGPDSRLRPLFPPEAVGVLVDRHVRGVRNHEKLLWALLGLEVFLRELAVEP